MTQVVEIIPHVLHGQYHECWCPSDARSQGIINNNDIGYVKPE